MYKEYIVILNYYNKSPELLELQIKSVLNQTLRPKEIWACFMGGNEKFKLFKKYIDITKGFDNTFFILSDYNFKYIGRYQLALTAKSEYIIMLDDDRIPRKDYCKKMVDILSKKNCIVQQYGWILNKPEELGGKFLLPFSKDNKFLPSEKDALITADYLCGGMCFRKSSLIYLFKEDIHTTETGEDIMFCLRAKKNNIPVYVHKPNKKTELLLHVNQDNNYTVTNSDIIKLRTEIIKKELNIV